MPAQLPTPGFPHVPLLIASPSAIYKAETMFTYSSLTPPCGSPATPLADPTPWPSLTTDPPQDLPMPCLQSSFLKTHGFPSVLKTSGTAYYLKTEVTNAYRQSKPPALVPLSATTPTYLPVTQLLSTSTKSYICRTEF